jgi:hypothetical protein
MSDPPGDLSQSARLHKQVSNDTSCIPPYSTRPSFDCRNLEIHVAACSDIPARGSPAPTWEFLHLSVSSRMTSSAAGQWNCKPQLQVSLLSMRVLPWRHAFGGGTLMIEPWARAQNAARGSNVSESNLCQPRRQTYNLGRAMHTAEHVV